MGDVWCNESESKCHSSVLLVSPAESCSFSQLLCQLLPGWLSFSTFKWSVLTVWGSRLRSVVQFGLAVGWAGGQLLYKYTHTHIMIPCAFIFSRVQSFLGTIHQIQWDNMIEIDSEKPMAKACMIQKINYDVLTNNESQRKERVVFISHSQWLQL